MFINNKSNDDGGAVYTQLALSFTHCNFINNRSEYYGGVVYSNTSSTKISNSIAWGNSAKYGSNQFYNVPCTYSCIEGGYTGTGNISTDPLFADAANGNYRLLVNSPAINKGSATAIPAGLTTDFDGIARQIGNAPDMGMYEAVIVTNFLPANNGVFVPSTYFPTEIKWGFSAESVGVLQPGTTFALQAWENGKPETLVIDDLQSQSTTYFTSAFTSNKVYQWRVGVVINSHTYWSAPSTFYVGRENPIYVKDGGTGNGDTWSTALGSLTDALNLANSGDRIWVAAGTYRPTTGTDRTVSFKLKPNVEVLGGFTVGGTLSFRNPVTNVTILSGDIGTTGVDSDNSYHVIYNNYTSTTPLQNSVLNGFVITGGNAGTTNGGGMLNEYANPTIRYCKFYNNKAVNGGAISNSNSSPRISNSLFYGNTATTYGGAIFTENSSIPTIVNCTITENSAVTNGGGGLKGTATVGNTIVYGNTGGQISGSPTVTYSCIEGGYTGTTNVKGNPKFVDATIKNYRLNSYSSCYNKGNNALLTSNETFLDLSFGESRLLGTVDIGAYEKQASILPGSIGITQITPTDNAAHVDIIAPIVITFNQPITVNSSLIALSGNSIKTQTLSTDGKILTLAMTSPWAFNQSVTISFADGAFAYIDNNLLTNFSSSSAFTVRACVNGAIVLTPSQTNFCPNSNITISANTTGDVNSNFRWQYNNAAIASLNDKNSYNMPKFNNMNQGVYNCSVSDMCGLTINSSIDLQLKTGLTKPVIKKKWDDVYLVDNSLELFSNYAWKYNGTSISGQQYTTIAKPSTGKLVVSALDAGSGCVVASDTLTIGSQSLIKSLSVAPNPVKQSQIATITFMGGTQSGTIRLLDSKGALVESVKFENVSSYPFDKTNLKPGIYFLDINGNETQSIVKIIIE